MKPEIGSARLGLIAALAVCGAGASTDAGAVAGTIVQNVQSGQCAVPQSASAGAAVIQTGCNVADDNLWRGEYFGNGYYRLRNAQTNLCLDLASVSPNNGIGVVQNVCSSSSTQLWRQLAVVGSATDKTLDNAYSGKCLDASVGTSFLQQWACGGVTNQKWRLVI